MDLTIRVYHEDPRLQLHKLSRGESEDDDGGKFASDSGTGEVLAEYTCIFDNDSDHASMKITTTSLPFNYWLSPSHLVSPSKLRSMLKKVNRVLKDLFLPLGYPRSVDSTYLPFQMYDALQGLCSYLRGVVSTSAVLEAAGVGDASATALSAAMAWALRDGNCVFCVYKKLVMVESLLSLTLLCVCVCVCVGVFFLWCYLYLKELVCWVALFSHFLLQMHSIHT